MILCPQGPNLNVLEHGYQVNNAWYNLINNVPEIFQPYWDKIQAELSLYNEQMINQYHIYHDCGKPFCIEYDTEGRRHFPNHAFVSYKTWLTVSNDTDIAHLILHDLDIHLPSTNMEDFYELKDSLILLLTGLAEIQANAELFGGQNSSSYKIKYKRWLKRAKWYLNRRYNG